jgi:glycosyltransferase involved in cell wall biosynthesis
MTENKAPADVCLILEGTYPFVSGGVAHWSHALIKQQPDLTFHIVAIRPPFLSSPPVFELPRNVSGMTEIFLQELPPGDEPSDKEAVQKLFASIELPMLKLQHFGRLEDLQKVIEGFSRFPFTLGSKILLESEESWHLTLRMYRSTMGDSSFLNFYFSWKGLIASLYSILLAPMPKAKIYHAASTGFAGLFLARAHLENKSPCLITEHGIYTNERRIEITLADWLYDQKTMDLVIDPVTRERDLKDFWIDTFFGYSRLCYAAASKIITLYHGNQEYQLADGAPKEKLSVIPNGVDIKTYGSVQKEPGRPPAIALIGRVVPIKDVKSFIHSVNMIKEKVPEVKALIIGPTDEEPEYFQECQELAQNLNLKETLSFVGKVRTIDYLPKIDVLVMTSISESQPLVVLEAGAAGIPCVTTDAGSCMELIYGKIDESPPLGAGGAVTPLSNPSAIADNIILLLKDPPYYASCSQAIKKRVETYYDEKEVQKNYQEIYHEMMEQSRKPEES